MFFRRLLRAKVCVQSGRDPFSFRPERQWEQGSISCGKGLLFCSWKRGKPNHEGSGCWRFCLPCFHSLHLSLGTRGALAVPLWLRSPGTKGSISPTPVKTGSDEASLPCICAELLLSFCHSSLDIDTCDDLRSRIPFSTGSGLPLSHNAAACGYREGGHRMAWRLP